VEQAITLVKQVPVGGALAANQQSAPIRGGHDEPLPQVGAKRVFAHARHSGDSVGRLVAVWQVRTSIASR
jgi:hypothetical protein